MSGSSSSSNSDVWVALAASGVPEWKDYIPSGKIVLLLPNKNAIAAFKEKYPSLTSDQIRRLVLSHVFEGSGKLSDLLGQGKSVIYGKLSGNPPLTFDKTVQGIKVSTANTTPLNVTSDPIAVGNSPDGNSSIVAYGLDGVLYPTGMSSLGNRQVVGLPPGGLNPNATILPVVINSSGGGGGSGWSTLFWIIVIILIILLIWWLYNKHQKGEIRFN